MSPCGVCILVTILCSAWSESTSEARLGPIFTTEPPSVVRYARASGARVACTAVAAGPAPTITWLADDGSTLSELPGVRRIYANGTLELVPSSGTTSDVPTTVRCRAANAHGTLLSRDVHLMSVTDGAWEVTVETGSTSVGGVAALRCRVSGAPARVALWYRADTLLAVDSPSPDSRYLSAGDTLLIRDVSAADAGAYSCVARHELTALTRRSRPAPLEVMPSSAVAGSAPRVTAASEVSVAPGGPFCLPCAASQYPPPHYTWYRESEGRLQPVEGGDAWRWADGAALCVKRANRIHAGVWLCKAYNVFGDATAQTRLDVHHELTVDLQPQVLVAEAGGAARLRCTSSATGAALQWLHDGVALASRGPDLELRGLTRGQRGTYQCVARDGLRSAQAAAEIRLGESPPELQYTFIEQALRGGAAVTLRCAAAASPPPRLHWLLDDQPLDRYLARHRYSVREETSISGETVSVLNISSAQPTDGGRYSCRASNPLGSVSHSARLNIYGPPAVRALEPVRAVAGDNLTLLCPYSGYPISSVRWSRRGAATALEGAGGRVWARAAALKLSPAMAQDAGHYTCTVTAPPAPPAARDIEIQVRNPPKISPFMFSPELTEGATVQVLCGVSSGDKPLYFSWFKDDQPLPSNLQIEEKSLNEFSLLMFPELRAAHSGRYTCRVANRAAAANYTAILTVKVAPSWETEPLDSAVLLGAPLKLDCAARGFPAPLVAWYKKIEGASSGDGTERWEATAPGWEGGERQSEGGQVSDAVRATLSARTALRSHQGLYRCSAENGVGPPLLKQVNITVHEPANFGTSSDVSRNTSAVLGQSATLSCLAHGDPPLTVHWTHHGHRLDLDNYRWRVTETRTAEGTRSALRLRAAERADAGEYRCVARNAHGRADLLLYLHVHEPPEAPRSLQLVGLGGTWVQLSWQARSPPGTRFTAFVASLEPSTLIPDQYNLTVQRDDHSEIMDTGRDKLLARLEALRAAHGYSLRLAAHNHVGTSPLSDPLRFTTLEEAPGGAPQNVRVRPVDSGEIHVSWSVPERDSWNGELLGYVVSWREAEGSGAGRVIVRGGGGEARVSIWGAKGRLAFTVRAFNRAGVSPPSHTVYAAAPAAGLVPPSAVRCEAVSARAVRVRWSPPASALLHYDIIYAPILFSQTWSGASRTAAAQADGSGGEAVVSGLRAAVNYSLSVRARTNGGSGPLSNPVYCQTKEDVPGAPEAVRAVAASAQAVRVTWAAPPPEVRGGRITHYTLYTRELGKVGGEWAQRVETEEDASEVRREVRGLRDGAVFEFWVRASTSAGPGAPSRAVTAAPAHSVSARISSVSTEIVAAVGTRVRLACAALGAPPLRRRWVPLPPTHTITDTGDLIINKLEERWSGNYTCSVRNAAGTDTIRHGVIAAAGPSTPVPRLLRADTHRLVVGWEAVRDGGAPLLHYSVQWRSGWGQKEMGQQIVGGEQAVGVDETRCEVGVLECGARYTITMRAHNAAGASPYSAPLQVRTSGDKALAPPGRQSIWANSSALRVSLLAWGGRCAVATWRAAYRPAKQPRTTWTAIHVDGETLEVVGLEPATWYEIRILAQAPAGETPALYRAATRSLAGDQIGEPIDLPVEARLSDVEDEVEVRSSGWGRTGLLSALGGGALALLLAAIILLASLRRTSGPTPPPTLHNGKSIDPPLDDCDEISPYATFSMSGSDSARGASAARACSLHVRSLPRSPLALAAPPMRHHLLAQPNEYGTCGSVRDTDSESSGSPCAACAAELYRLPAAHLSDTLPAGATTAAESSTEDGSYGSRHLRPRDIRDTNSRDIRDTRDMRDGRDTQQRRARRIARPQQPTISHRF
ncbi:Down syndrome cell adhesion molecule-like protein Dscam2 isoform X3 [Pieris napi]|uniref:Down syndrome cell adhesion molecule-like protein Dscam2 isoform X3 n=1 Tax=Pieris napi TaxID=78633 RepID=UPI001FBB82CB|nr:Down syndrome cell adhesion molecule-like protein Dscam2 isoform X3 [Pieris napi]